VNYLKYFGFTSIPFHKSNDYVWINRQVKEFEDKFRRLIEVPGIGLLVGDAGVGKTTLIKHVMNRVKSPKIRYFYFCETDFTRNEFYLILADQFGVDTSSKRSIVWRNLKKHIMHMSETQAITPIIIIDEAHNLPDLFFKDLPAFLNFNMDSRDPLVLWLLGASSLSRKLNTPMCHALNSRIRLWQTLNGLTEFEDFKSFVNDGLKEVGASGNFLTDSGLNLLFETTKGKPRQISNIIINGLQKSAQKDYKHIPDDVLEDAIYECR
jgi:MSHA biogenesis protein MshM